MASVEIQIQDPGLPSLARHPKQKKNVPKGATPPPPMNVEDIPWRGHGGRAPTMSSVEFDRQLDKISVWLEDWTHEQRCLVIEGILRRSNYNQFQFLNTSLQPILHRDFLYTARSHFPAIDFLPVSTHTSRKLKERLVYTRQDDFHRLQSAHLRLDEEVRQLVQEKERPKFPTIQSRTASHNISKETHDNGSPMKKAKKSKTHTDHMTNIKKWVGDSDNPLYDSLPHIRYIDMPVRRHIQDENSPRLSSSHQSTSASAGFFQNGSISSSPNITAQSDWDFQTNKKPKTKHKKSRKEEAKGMESAFPEEGYSVYKWFTKNWSDVKRNEFLHKFLLKMDPRQHYFVSSLLTARRYKDFISLLQSHIALKILDYLSVQDLLRCCKVSKAWNKLANNNDLWKAKCDLVKLEIPIRTDNPDWKRIYKDNTFLRVNWNDGNCKITDFKGHTDNVICVKFEEDKLASGGLDKTVRVWDMRTGTCQHVLKGHTKGVWCLNFFTENLLISGSYDGTIRNDDVIRKCGFRYGDVICNVSGNITISMTRIDFVGYDDAISGVMKVWNLRLGKCSKTIFAHDGPVWAMVRYKDILITGSQDKTAKVWDINRCFLTKCFQGHAAAVFAVDMNEDGRLVITGSADKTVKVWNRETGQCLRWINVSQSTSIMAVSYSQGYLACSYGETICVYKVEGPTRLVKKYNDIVNEHMKRIETLKLMMFNKETGEGMIVSAGKDGRVKYWNLNKDKSIQTFVGHRGEAVQCIHFDELRIASAAQDHKIRVWDFNV